MSYPYGQAITYWFYPLIDDASPSTLLTSQTPAIYVFTTQPSRSVAAAGTGAAQSVTSWTWDAEKKGWYFTITAIDDPDTSAVDSSRTYWIAINFRLETSAQIQTHLRELPLRRVSGHDKAVGTTHDTLRSYYPQVDAYSTDPQRTASISQAIEDVKARLKNAGYQWARLHRADRLTYIVAHRALAILMLGQAQQANDKFFVKYQEFKGLFQTSFDALQLEYDSNDDGTPDTTTTASSEVLWVVR